MIGDITFKTGKEHVKFVSENKVVINGLHYRTALGLKTFKIAIGFKDGKWILKEKIMTGIS